MKVRFIRSLSPHHKGKEVELSDKQAAFLIKHKVVEEIVAEKKKVGRPAKPKAEPKAKEPKKYKTKVLVADAE